MADEANLGGEPAESSGLHEVLQFLFDAKIAATDAFAVAKAFIEGGVNSRAAIAELTPDRVKALAPAKLSRKIVSAIKRMPKQGEPASEPSASPLKRARPSPHAPDPPLPPLGESPPESVRVNRSPVMILWGANVALALGYDWSEALSLASAAAGLIAQRKGSSLGILPHGPPALPARAAGAAGAPSLLGLSVPAARTAHGWRGLSPRTSGAGGFEEVHPLSVFRRLQGAFAGSGFAHVHAAMAGLARAVPAPELRASANQLGYALYAQFRPHVSDGRSGWGEHGTLELAAIRRLGDRFAPPRGDAALGAAAPAGAAAAPSAAASPPSAPPSLEAVFEAIGAAGPAGAPLAALALALSCSEPQALCAVEALQLDGAVFQSEQGAYLHL